jgi:hypothetical protein
MRSDFLRLAVPRCLLRPRDILSLLLLLRAPSLRLLARSTFRSELYRAYRVPCPLRDFTSAQPLFARTPTSSLRSVLRFSQPLDGLLRAQARRLISSRCHVQDLLPFRGFSPRAATLPHRKEPAPRSLLRKRLTHLRRLPPLPDLDFEAFIRARPRSPLRSYSPRIVPLPSSSFSPPGPLTPHGRFQLTQNPPLSTFLLETFACAFVPKLRPQRFLREVLGSHVSASARLLEVSSLPSASPISTGFIPRSPK